MGIQTWRTRIPRKFRVMDIRTNRRVKTVVCHARCTMHEIDGWSSRVAPARWITRYVGERKAIEIAPKEKLPKIGSQEGRQVEAGHGIPYSQALRLEIGPEASF